MLRFIPWFFTNDQVWSFMILVVFSFKGSHKLFLQFPLTGKISAQVQSHITSRIRFNYIPSISTHKCQGMKILTPACAHSYSSLPQTTLEWSEYKAGERNLTPPEHESQMWRKGAICNFPIPLSTTKERGKINGKHACSGQVSNSQPFPFDNTFVFWR